MISTPTKPETTETPIRWAVGLQVAWETAIDGNVSTDAVVFDDLKAAFEAARASSAETGEMLTVFGLHEPRPLVAVACAGQMFYQVADWPTPQPEPSPTNPLRSAFPWTVNPCEDFSVEPGLSKREWMAAIVASGAVAKDLVPAVDIADECVVLADALLKRLGPQSQEPDRAKGYMHPTEGWTQSGWPA
jgi:hypothetical protein